MTRTHRTPRRVARLVAALLGLALVAAACAGGDEASLRRTIEGELVAGDSPEAAAEATVDPVSGEPTTQTSIVTTGGGQAAAPQGGGGGGVPAAPAAPSGPVDRNSDRGVTDSTIKLGVISVLSGGQRFVGEPPYRTALAYAEDINRRGGINGRQLEVIGYDVCISCPEDGLAAAIKAVEEDGVFAILNGFVANASLRPAIDYLSKNETPMIQTSGKPTVDPWVYAFGLHLPYRGAIDADYANDYLEEKGLPKKVALLRFNTPLDEEVQKWQRIALQKHGIEIVDEVAIEYGAGMTNQGSQTSKMQAAGAELIVGSHGVVCAFNMLSAGQNDWDVPYLCTILYDQYAQELAGDTIYERDVMADSDGYATPDMPGPGVEKYNRVMSTFYPGYDVGLLTLYSFLGMQVFEDCAAPQGDNLTRTGIQQCLAGLNGYDGGGLVPPFTVTPTDHTAIKGAVRLKLKPDGSWENVSNGFVYPDPIHGLPR